MSTTTTTRTTYRTFTRSYLNWTQFAKGRKTTVDRRLTYNEARRACVGFNQNRNEAQKQRGTMMEFEAE